MDKIRTGELIKNARIQKGYTQRELGDRIGVSNKAVSRWENGDSFPDVGVLESLAGELELSLEDIIVGEKRKQEERMEQVLTEVLHVARLQASRKKRMWIYGLAGGILLAYVLICGSLTLFVSWVDIPWYLYGIGLILSTGVLVITNRNGGESGSKVRYCPKEKGILWGTIGISVFLVVLFGIVCLQFGILPKTEIAHPGIWGKGLNAVLIGGYSIGIVILGGSWLQSLRTWQPGEIRLLALGLIHLSFLYSSLLHHMSSMERFATAYGSWTGIVAAVTVLAIVIEKRYRATRQ